MREVKNTIKGPKQGIKIFQEKKVKNFNFRFFKKKNTEKIFLKIIFKKFIKFSFRSLIFLH